MKVQTAGLGSGLSITFELTDLSPADQRELFVMAGRRLGIFDKLSSTAVKEIDELLIEHSKVSP